MRKLLLLGLFSLQFASFAGKCHSDMIQIFEESNKHLSLESKKFINDYIYPLVGEKVYIDSEKNAKVCYQAKDCFLIPPQDKSDFYLEFIIDESVSSVEVIIDSEKKRTLKISKSFLENSDKRLVVNEALEKLLKGHSYENVLKEKFKNENSHLKPEVLFFVEKHLYPILGDDIFVDKNGNIRSCFQGDSCLLIPSDTNEFLFYKIIFPFEDSFVEENITPYERTFVVSKDLKEEELNENLRSFFSKKSQSKQNEEPIKKEPESNLLEEIITENEEEKVSEQLEEVADENGLLSSEIELVENELKKELERENFLDESLEGNKFIVNVLDEIDGKLNSLRKNHREKFVKIFAETYGALYRKKSITDSDLLSAKSKMTRFLRKMARDKIFNKMTVDEVSSFYLFLSKIELKGKKILDPIADNLNLEHVYKSFIFEYDYYLAIEKRIPQEIIDSIPNDYSKFIIGRYLLFNSYDDYRIIIENLLSETLRHKDSKSLEIEKVREMVDNLRENREDFSIRQDEVSEKDLPQGPKVLDNESSSILEKDDGIIDDDTLLKKDEKKNEEEVFKRKKISTINFPIRPELGFNPSLDVVLKGLDAQLVSLKRNHREKFISFFQNIYFPLSKKNNISESDLQSANSKMIRLLRRISKDKYFDKMGYVEVISFFEHISEITFKGRPLLFNRSVDLSSENIYNSYVMEYDFYLAIESRLPHETLDLITSDFTRFLIGRYLLSSQTDDFAAAIDFVLSKTQFFNEWKELHLDDLRNKVDSLVRKLEKSLETKKVEEITEEENVVLKDKIGINRKKKNQREALENDKSRAIKSDSREQFNIVFDQLILGFSSQKKDILRGLLKGYFEIVKSGDYDEIQKYNRVLNENLMDLLNTGFFSDLSFAEMRSFIKGLDSLEISGHQLFPELPGLRIDIFENFNPEIFMFSFIKTYLRDDMISYLPSSPYSSFYFGRYFLENSDFDTEDVFLLLKNFLMKGFVSFTREGEDLILNDLHNLGPESLIELKLYSDVSFLEIDFSSILKKIVSEEQVKTEEEATISSFEDIEGLKVYEIKTQVQMGKRGDQGTRIVFSNDVLKQMKVHSGTEEEKTFIRGMNVHFRKIELLQQLSDKTHSIFELKHNNHSYRLLGGMRDGIFFLVEFVHKDYIEKNNRGIRASVNNKVAKLIRQYDEN